MRFLNVSLFFLITLMFSSVLVSAQNSTCVYFFHGEGCQHCAKVEPIINKLEVQSEFPVEVHKFEIYNNRSNMLLLTQYFEAYNFFWF